MGYEEFHCYPLPWWYYWSGDPTWRNTALCHDGCYHAISSRQQMTAQDLPASSKRRYTAYFMTWVMVVSAWLGGKSSQGKPVHLGKPGLSARTRWVLSVDALLSLPGSPCGAWTTQDDAPGQVMWLWRPLAPWWMMSKLKVRDTEASRVCWGMLRGPSLAMGKEGARESDRTVWSSVGKGENSRLRSGATPLQELLNLCLWCGNLHCAPVFHMACESGNVADTGEGPSHT